MALSNEHIGSLADELRALLERYRDAGLSYLELVGMLEITKHDVLRELYEPDPEMN